jgi:hypothetical protein
VTRPAPRYAQARTEGAALLVRYRWADGWTQTALFTRAQAAEHCAWMLRTEGLFARHLSTRDIATGRYVRPAFRAIVEGGRS